MRGACVVLLISREWSFTGNLTVCADLKQVFLLLRSFAIAFKFWAVVSRNIV